MSTPKTIAIIGAGTIGASWASLFLARGLSVRCSDPSAEAETFTRAYVDRALSEAENSLDLAEAQSRLNFLATPGEAADGADFAQENAPERLDLKRRLLAEIEESIADTAIIASSTSGLMPSDMQNGMTRPERFIVGHPFNPPHLLPLVEVVGGRQTSQETIASALTFYAEIGKRPIHLRKEINGHIANRLQAALWREAVHLAVEGVASVSDIDAAVVAGPGLRWALMGPHLTLHLAGGDGGIDKFIGHLGPAFESWWAELGSPRLDANARTLLSEGVREEVGTRQLSELAESRDQALKNLLKFSKPLF
ncbi:3-hydroxyacyl-CoA dehydrogenase NAD-binding domain-containing protein [Microvirga puerhi]|uniref:3-hydroxyacyl-CoA dehydrogenase n=1 Tax=Microvirga puerhi TaxID=2876078 RepID=A0ABS7VRS5_9HYPH|nr:3-hydroxyacyl-CoA dehydrogenase NAD-binding domain-containing protein [Microvirga puerhi]MBZ6078257.1 3-hydroxyacyl-CoA dehydrogenase [Microvirga puerhi]